MAPPLAVVAQHLLPKQALTQLAGHLAGTRGGKAVIATRGRHDAARQISLVERQQFIGRAARLERTGRLQQFELHPQLVVPIKAVPKGCGLHHRCAAHIASNTALGGADVVDLDDHEISPS